MMIWINEKQEVISVASGACTNEMTPDNQTSFAVQEVPTVATHERLCFDRTTQSFFTKQCVERDDAALQAAKERAMTIREAQQKRDRILQWFSENDWKINKRALGEWAEDDPRWISYLEERCIKRAAYDLALEDVSSKR